MFAFGGNLASQNFGSHAFDRLFACGIDVEDEDGVGVGEGGCEIVHEIAGAGVAVGLEDYVDMMESALAGSGEGGAGFGWWMAVILNYADAGRLAAGTGTAVQTPGVGETGGALVRR